MRSPGPRFPRGRRRSSSAAGGSAQQASTVRYLRCRSPMAALWWAHPRAALHTHAEQTKNRGIGHEAHAAQYYIRTQRSQQADYPLCPRWRAATMLDVVKIASVCINQGWSYECPKCAAMYRVLFSRPVKRQYYEPLLTGVRECEWDFRERND